jgi:PAS domain S-box-containing protein
MKRPADIIHRLLPRSLRGLAITLMLVILLPALMVQGFFGYRTYQQQIAREKLANLEAARAAGQLFEAYVRDIGRQLAALGRTVIELGPANPAASEFLTERQRDYTSVVDITWLSPEGVALASSRPAVIGQSFTDRRYFQLALQQEQWVLGDLLRHRFTGEPAFMVARAIRDGQGEVLGVMVAVVKVEALSHSVFDVPRPLQGTILLFDREGRLVYRGPGPEISWAQRDPALWFGEETRSALAGYEVTAALESPIDGVERVIARSPIKSLGYVAGAGRPVEEVTNPALLAAEIAVAINLFAVAVSLAVVLLLLRGLDRSFVATGRYVESLGFERASQIPPPPLRVRELASLAEASRDMAARRDRSSDSLRQAEARLRAVLDVLPAAIFISDAHGKLLETNEAAREIWGGETPTDISPQQYDKYEAWWPDGRKLAAEDWAMARAVRHGERIGPEEVRIRCFDGTYKTILNYASPICGKDGKVLGAVAVNIDITQRKRDEQELRQAERRFRTVADYTYDWEYWLSPDLDRMLYISPAVKRITGRDRQEFIDRPELLSEIIHPDDRQLWSRHSSRRDTRHDEELEVRIIRADGEVRWISHLCRAVIDSDGEYLGIRASNRDITERKRDAEALAASEQRYSRLFNNNHAAMLLIDPESGKIADANPAACQFYGYEYQRLTSMKITDVNVLDPEEVKRRIQQAADDQHHRFEFPHRLSSGEVRQVEVYSGPIEVAGREMLYSIIHDVTPEYRQRRQIEEYARELKRSNEDLEQFAYVASHDLQEPLRMVTGFMNLLESRYSDKLDESGREFIGFAVDGAMRMQSLIQDLLAYSRVGTRGKRLRKLNPDKPLDKALGNLQQVISETGAQVVRGDLPEVMGDEAQLAQLFQNLIANAIKFRRPGVTPHVEIGGRCGEDECTMWVSDNGIGIPADQQKRVFMIFQRLHQRQEYPGTGIGLAVCKRIVDRHGGRIWLESKEGEGSTFYFTLPLTAPPELGDGEAYEQD